jgi:DNA polymerase-1
MTEYIEPAVYAPPPRQMYPDQACEIIRPLLYGGQAKIGHNLKFDLMSMAKYYDDEIPPGPYHDTLILTHCLDEDLQSYGIKDLTGDWFEIPYKQRPAWYPNMGKAGIEKFGLDQVARYLAKDVRYCWLRFRKLFSKLRQDGVLDTYDFEMSVYPSIMAMEYAGFPVDLTQIDSVRADLERDIHVAEQQAWKLADGRFNLSQPEAKRWVLFGENGWVLNKKTGEREGRPMFSLSQRKPLKPQNLEPISRTEKTGVAQVTQEVLEVYVEKGNPMAVVLLEWSSLEKLRGTFIGMPDHEITKRVKVKDENDDWVWVDQVEPVASSGIYSRMVTGLGPLPTVHSSFKQHGTKTGRLSAEQPNLQQLPRGSTIRKLFVAPPGSVLIVADYDQIELRCLAYEAQEPAMIEIFRQHRDIHAEATAVAMQILLEQVTSDMRQVGKTLNFATGYGAGPERIAFVAGVSVRRGQQFLDRYYDEFRALEPWKRKLLKEARYSGDKRAPGVHPPYVLIPPFGRKRRLPLLYHDKYGLVRRAERQAVNARIQGFASSITKLAMRDLLEELRPYPANMLAQVHDEIVVRVDEDAAEEVKPLVERVMSGVCEPFNGTPILGDIPLLVSASSGHSWAEAKGK